MARVLHRVIVMLALVLLPASLLGKSVTGDRLLLLKDSDNYSKLTTLLSSKYKLKVASFADHTVPLFSYDERNFDHILLISSQPTKSTVLLFQE